jgi:hypothetical protein
LAADVLPEAERARALNPEWALQLSRDFVQSGSQFGAYPDPEWAPNFSFFDDMSQSDAIASLIFLWASVRHPDFIAHLLSGPGGPFAEDSLPEDRPSAPREIEAGTAPSDPAEWETFLRFLRQIPGPWRELLGWTLRNPEAALKAALRILRRLRAHRGTPVRRLAATPAVLASQRIRMHLAAHPTHAP